MPFEANRIIVTGSADELATSAYSRFSVDIATTDKFLNYGFEGLSGSGYSYEFVMQGTNPEVGTIYHPFGYNGQPVDGDSHVTAIYFDLAEFRWIAWNNLGIHKGISGLATGWGDQSGDVGLSRIMIQTGKSSRTPERGHDEILLYVCPVDKSTKQAAEELPLRSDIGSTPVWSSYSTMNFMVSTNAQRIPNGSETLIWNFECGDPFLDFQDWDSNYLAIYPLSTSGLYYLGPSDGVTKFSIATYKNNIGPDNMMGRGISTGNLSSTASYTSSIFPYITLEFCFIPLTQATDRKYSMAVPVLTKAQTEKLFNYVGRV